MPGTLPLAGRESALGAVTQLLRSASDGRGGLLALSGPAGVGRTRMGEEADRLARRQGFAVVWGAATADRPGSPWPTVRRALQRQAGEGQGGGAQGSDDPLVALPLDRPTLFVLDDLQHADSDALGIDAAGVWQRRLRTLERDDVMLLQLLVAAAPPTRAAQLALLAHRSLQAVTTGLHRLAAAGHISDPAMQVWPGSLGAHLRAGLGPAAIADIQDRVAALGTAAAQVAGPAAGPPQPLPRPRLLRVLDDAGAVRAITVVADAGFGKTTLLGQWAADRPAAWLSLRAAHDAPERLAADLLERLPAIAPEVPVDSLRRAVTAARSPDAAGAQGRQVGPGRSC